jgi:hypothetical protein
VEEGGVMAARATHQLGRVVAGAPACLDPRGLVGTEHETADELNFIDSRLQIADKLNFIDCIQTELYRLKIEHPVQ